MRITRLMKAISRTYNMGNNEFLRLGAEAEAQLDENDDVKAVDLALSEQCKGMILEELKRIKESKKSKGSENGTA